MTRVFVAIPLPDGIAETLARASAGLNFGRSVAPENMHLTLRFVGDCTDETLDELDRRLSAIRVAPIDLAFSGPGGFGSGTPRILYWGVEPTPELFALKDAVESAIRRSGITLASERFVPHVTLVRGATQGGTVARLGEWLARARHLRPEGFRAYGFALFASELHPDGARYSQLSAYPLTR